MGDHNSYCWADLTTGDRLGAKKFYEALFGWKIFPGKDKDESTYLHIMSGERGIGGIQPDMMRKPGVPPHWLPYFLVADVDAVTAKAKDLGGTALVPPMIVGDVAADRRAGGRSGRGLRAVLSRKAGGWN